MENKMTKVTVDHSAYIASHGKPAKGKGSWVFAATRDANVDDMVFCSPGTVAQCAKEAAAKLNVTTVFAQP